METIRLGAPSNVDIETDTPSISRFGVPPHATARNQLTENMRSQRKLTKLGTLVSTRMDVMASLEGRYIALFFLRRARHGDIIAQHPDLHARRPTAECG